MLYPVLQPVLIPAPSSVRVLAAAVAAVLATGLLAGCSSDDDCTGRAYHPALDQQGAETPIGALEAWLGSHEGFGEEPPDEGWIQQDSGQEDAATVVLTNDDWWVSAVRTSSGGYVVAQATDDAADCGDELAQGTS
jgi:hypothetical protein